MAGCQGMNGEWVNKGLVPWKCVWKTHACGSLMPCLKVTGIGYRVVSAGCLVLHQQMHGDAHVCKDCFIINLHKACMQALVQCCYISLAKWVYVSN